MKRSRTVATTSTVDQTLLVSAVGVNVGAAVVTLFTGAMVAVVVGLPTTSWSVVVITVTEYSDGSSTFTLTVLI